MLKQMILIITILLPLPAVLFADGGEVKSGDLLCGTQNIEGKESKVNVEPTDPRLPPLIPGEVVDGGDKKIRVLTTAGPVPVVESQKVCRQGEASCLHPALSGGVSVLVDRRRQRRSTSKGAARSRPRSMPRN